MQHAFSISVVDPQSLSPEDICRAAGITCSGNPSLTRVADEIVLDLPGVESLTAWQAAALEILTTYRETGKEPYPGLVSQLLEQQDLQAATEERVIELLTDLPKGDPLALAVFLSALIVNQSLNQIREEPVPLQDVLQGVVAFVRNGGLR